MAVNKKALYRRAARHCAQTAEEARDAIGYFAVPTFPVRWDDPNRKFLSQFTFALVDRGLLYPSGYIPLEQYSWHMG